MKNIVLMGFMGSGKTTVGRVLAEKLGFLFVDTDDEIEKLMGISVKDIFAKYDSAYFRELESRVIKKVANRENLVIATGGGAVLNPDNVAALKNSGITVLLRCSPEVILKRLENVDSRPLLAGAEDLEVRIRELLAERDKVYTLATDLEIEIDGEDIPTIADRIIALLKERE